MASINNAVRDHNNLLNKKNKLRVICSLSIMIDLIENNSQKLCVYPVYPGRALILVNIYTYVYQTG